MRRSLLKAIFVYNPLIVGVLNATFGGVHDFARRMFVALVIADTVTLLCFGGALVAGHVERAWLARRRLPPKPRTSGFSFLVAALLLPVALPVGLLAAARAAPVVGLERPVDLHGYRVGLGFGFLVTAVFFLQFARAEAREAEARAEARARELENTKLRAQLAALSAEMNPHMLFNALNTIASLVHGDPDLAESTVLELAELYRGTLRACRETMHGLDAEMRLCEAYLRVEKARFRDRLTVDIVVDASLDASSVQVPVLLVQPLVENAILHGIGPRARGGSVRVLASRQGDAVVIVVEDDGVGLVESEGEGARPARPRNGRALANCRERIALTFGTAGAIHITGREAGGTRATVSLPLTVAT